VTLGRHFSLLPRCFANPSRKSFTTRLESVRASAAAMKRPTKVRIEEVAPDTDRLVKDHPAQAAQLLKKYIGRSIKGKANRRRAIEEALNKSRRQDAQERKSTALDIAARLKQKDQTLRFKRKTSELARRIRIRWPKGEPPPSTRHICRLLRNK